MRIIWPAAGEAELEGLVEVYWGKPGIGTAVGYLEGGLGNWTTCLLYERMEPTNNLAEQDLREHVVVRKLVGTFRSEETAENYQYLAAMVDTWRFQGRDPYRELEGLLRGELCG